MAMKRFRKVAGHGITVAFRGVYATLSAGAIELLEKPERIDFLYDEESGEVGLQAGEDYRVGYKDGWGGATITAKAFIREYGLSGKKFKGMKINGLAVFTEQNGLPK